MIEPTPWGRRRGITAVVRTATGYTVFGRDWHAVLTQGRLLLALMSENAEELANAYAFLDGLGISSGTPDTKFTLAERISRLRTVPLLS